MRGENDMRLQIGLGYAFVAALLASKRRLKEAENEPRMSRSGKRREPFGAPVFRERSGYSHSGSKWFRQIKRE